MALASGEIFFLSFRLHTWSEGRMMKQVAASHAQLVDVLASWRGGLAQVQVPRLCSAAWAETIPFMEAATNTAIRVAATPSTELLRYSHG